MNYWCQKWYLKKTFNLRKKLNLESLPAGVVVGVPSAHAMIDNVTSSGALLSVVLLTFIIISLTFSVGNWLAGNDVGAPRMEIVS